MQSFLVGINDAEGEHEGDGMPVTAMSEDEAIESAKMYFPGAPRGYWIIPDPDADD